MQKRASNRYPPPTPAPTPPRPVLSAKAEEALRRGWLANFSFLNGYTLIEPTDSYRSIRLLFDTSQRIEALCDAGDLDTLRLVIQEIRESECPIMNKPNTWHFFETGSGHFGKALQNDRWDMIKFLTEIPFAIPPSIGHRVADLALHERSTEKLQRLYDLGWNINDNGTESRYSEKVTTALWSVLTCLYSYDCG